MPKSPHGPAAPTMAPEQKIQMIKAVSFVWSCDGYSIMCDQQGSEMWRKTLKLEHEKHFDARQVTVLLKLFTSGPRKGEGYVFAGFNRFAIAMDATTGDTVWIHTFDESFARGPVTFAVFPKTPVIYVASKGKIKGIFADDGTKKWSRNLPGTGYDVVNMCIGKSKEQLFAGTRGNVFLVNGENGEIVWNKQIKGNRFGQSTSACHTCVCLCDNGHQVMYGMHGRLGGLAAATGDQIWEFKIKKLECTDSIVPVLAVSLKNQHDSNMGVASSSNSRSKQFVFAASAGVVYCVDPQQSNGEALVWERDLFAGIKLAIEQPALTFADGKVILTMAAHCIALDPYSGQIIWATHLPKLNASLITVVSQSPGTVSCSAIGCIQVLDTDAGTIMKTLVEEPRVGRNAMVCLAGIGYDTEMNSNPMQAAAASIESLGKDFRGVAPKKRGDLTEMWRVSMNRPRYSERRNDAPPPAAPPSFESFEKSGSELTADMVHPPSPGEEEELLDEEQEDFFNGADESFSRGAGQVGIQKSHEAFGMEEDDDGWGLDHNTTAAAPEPVEEADELDDDLNDALAAIDEIDDFFGGGESAPVAKATTPAKAVEGGNDVPDLFVGESVDDLLG